MADATPPQPPGGLDEIRAILAELAVRDKRLTERHEALAQSLELSHHGLQEFKAEVRKFTSRAEADLERDASNIRTLADIARDALASIQSLERIATAHRSRLDDHEKRIEDLEK